ncbi:DNA-3-methyladenine glycosylase I [Streptococcus equinus]|uniref:DNA-3-methyladenine glycosylase I n=1 Tax=Streptococcus equinus TaxID=1335 RepID=UPI00088D8EE2|nr:DNA-3-methyladenine glycosylase I [Streptococcus equinus]SDQ39970.1 DNA-3-methyladenine glycosylase I [Streptococcus equinus]
MKRCSWVKESNPLYVAYHDTEWGKTLHDDQALFELLCLETYQAGLSWETILNKRASFNQAFYDYDVAKVAQMSDDELEVLLQNPAIVRNRRKIYATRTNAKAFIKIQKEFGSFDKYLWSWVDNTPIVNDVENYATIPVSMPLSENLSKDLKKRGFKFVGPVCAYSFLQAAGLVNDHEIDCDFR